MSARVQVRRILVSLVVAPLLALVVALVWYAEWVALQDYPPLRITSVVIGGIGLFGLAADALLRRMQQAQRTRWHAFGERGVPPPAPVAPDRRAWLVAGLYGLLVTPLSIGSQAVAITQLPLVVVVIAATAGEAWRLVLVPRELTVVGAIAVVLSIAAVAAVALGPDVAAPRMFAVLVLATVVRAIGKDRWASEQRAGQRPPLAAAMVVAAVVLQLAGLSRGEEFGDAGLRATLALAAPLLALVAFLVLALVASAGYPAVLRRACAGTVVLTLGLGHALCAQPVASATWVAVGLVALAALIQPFEVGAASQP